ncbi:hypothetical protein GQ53DRAFT_827348 [Thozetella sp. PMI_491]|nr:hypothetical protein GQ53DRAFT_827348 [Thozetella sp. PMI_491]
MDRGRGRGRGRRRGSERQTSSHSATSGHQPTLPLADPSSPITDYYQDTTEDSFAHHFPSPSIDSPSSRITPRSERPPRNNTQPEFTFRAPSVSGATMGSPALGKKRARTVDNTQEVAAADEANPKGGHQLRKRARVDYTQGRIDDDIAPFQPRLDPTGKATVGPGGRIRKRHTTHELSDDDSDDGLGASIGHQRRRRSDKGLALLQDTPNRRKNPARKSTTEIRTYVDDQPSDNEVQDAIVVGAPLEESEHSSFRQSLSPRPTSSASSLEKDLAQSQPPVPIAQPEPELQEQLRTDVEAPAPQLQDIERPLIKEEKVDQDEHVNTKETMAPSPPATQDAATVIHDADTKEPEQELAPEKSNDYLVKTLDEPGKADEAVPAKEAAVSPSPDIVASPDRMSIDRDAPDQESQTPQAQQALPTQPEKVASPTPTPVPESQERSDDTPRESTEPKVEEPFVPDAVPAITSEPSQSSQLALELADRPAIMKELQKFYTKVTAKSSPSSAYEDETVAHPARSGRVLRSNKAESSSVPSRPPSPPPIRRPKPKTLKLTKLSTQVDAAKQSDLIQPKEASQASTPAASGVSNEASRVSLPSKWTFKTFWKLFYSKYRAQCEASGEMRDTPYAIWRQFSTQPPEEQLRMMEVVTEGAGLAAQLDAAAEDRNGPADKTKGKQLEAHPNADADIAPRSQEALDVPSSTPGPTPELVEDDPAAEDAIVTNDEGDDNDEGDAEESGKQYAFPRIRDPSQFEDLKNYASMPTEALTARLTELWDYMAPLQEEFSTLQKFLEDEENAKRRQQNDKAITNWDARQNMDEPLPLRRHFDDLVKGPPVFEVKGRRAPRPYVDDPVLDHQREMDKILADAWGFKHSNLPTLIGRQNPNEQRWEMPEPRLRERKQTQKAADLAEEHILEGKRTRKPRVLADREPGRASTPAEPLRRGKGRALASLAEEFEAAEFKGRRLDPFAAEGIATGRRRRAAAARQPPSVNVTEDEADMPPSRPKRQRATRIVEDTTLDPSASQTAAEDSTRPSTSSSDTSQTAETGESAYSLREKKPRNYAADNDPEAVPRPRKRNRTSALKTEEFYGTPGRSGAERFDHHDDSMQNGDDHDEPPKKRRRRTKKTAPTSGQRPLLAAAPIQPAPPGRQSVMAPPAGPSFHTFEMVGNKLIDVHPHNKRLVPAPPAGGYQDRDALLSTIIPPQKPEQVAFGPAPASNGEKETATSSSSSPKSNTLEDTPQAGGNETGASASITVFAGTNGRTMLRIKARVVNAPIHPAIRAARGSLATPSPDRPYKNTRSRSLQISQPTGNPTTLNPIAPNTKTPIMRVTPASRAGANASAAGGAGGANAAAAAAGTDGGEPKKAYSEMSKSEKMSWSMKNRWARGEMKGAVEKRKNTLAQKQKAKVATDAVARAASTTTPASDSRSTAAGSSSGGKATESKRSRTSAAHERAAVPVITPANRPAAPPRPQQSQYGPSGDSASPTNGSYPPSGLYASQKPENPPYSLAPPSEPVGEQDGIYHQRVNQTAFPPAYDNGSYYKSNGGESTSA